MTCSNKQRRSPHSKADGHRLRSSGLSKRSSCMARTGRASRSMWGRAQALRYARTRRSTSRSRSSNSSNRCSRSSMNKPKSSQYIRRLLPIRERQSKSRRGSNAYQNSQRDVRRHLSPNSKPWRKRAKLAKLLYSILSRLRFSSKTLNHSGYHQSLR